MTEKLYRDEALEHQYRGLYGEVTLSAPPASWIITSILILVFGIIAAVMVFGRVETSEGTISVLNWLLTRGQNA